MKLYFIAGASGSGKSAIMNDLHKNLGDSFHVYDFDDIGVPEGADKKWRQESTEKWLKKMLAGNQSSVLLGQMVLGEILACPSANKLGKVNFCFLDVDDQIRIERLKNHSPALATQDMLNWAAWLRMHHLDPQWTQEVIKQDCWKKLELNSLESLNNWSAKANVKVLDTTRMSIADVAGNVADWIQSEPDSSMQQIPNTELTIHSNLQNAYEIIDQKLFEYNKQCVPPTQSPEVIYKSFIIKDGDNVIAGIHADIYVWNILFIDVIFVDEKYRKNGLGSILLNKIEKEAIARGVTLAHLDTFDFQGRLFYEKNGYEVFGVLNDCPQGHKRFYMSKLLNNDMT